MKHSNSEAEELVEALAFESKSRFLSPNCRSLIVCAVPFMSSKGAIHSSLGYCEPQRASPRFWPRSETRKPITKQSVTLPAAHRIHIASRDSVGRQCVSGTALWSPFHLDQALFTLMQAPGGCGFQAAKIYGQSLVLGNRSEIDSRRLPGGRTRANQRTEVRRRAAQHDVSTNFLLRTVPTPPNIDAESKTTGQ